MSSELQWMLLRSNSSFLVHRSGHNFSREPTNPARIHSFKYCGLVQPGVQVLPVSNGVSITRRSTKVPANKVATSYPTPSIIKKGSDAGARAAKVARDMQATGFRLDLVRATQARVSAYLLAGKARKVHTVRPEKLAKLTKKN